MGIQIVDGSAAGGGAGTVTGTGTADQLAVWSGASAIGGSTELARTATQVQFVVSSAGGTVGHVTQNTDNTNAASHAFFYASNGGTSGGDAFYRAGVSGSTQWSFGVDNSDSDAFCLTNASTLNGTNLLRMGTDSAAVVGYFTLSAISSNKVILATPSAATTATAVEIQGGACSTASAVGGNLILRGGAPGSGAERGTVLIGGTANTAGNRPCFGSETDAVGFLGYDYAGGAYKRFAFAYFATEMKVGGSTSTDIGVQIGKGSVGGFISFIQSTANKGPSIQSEYAKCMTINQPSADGGAVYFSFGNISDQTKNGQFWFHKTTEADLKWNTDGAGDIGASGANRPNNIYVKTNARIGGNLGVGNSAAATTLGSVTKKIEIFDASGSSLGFIPVYDAIT